MLLVWSALAPSDWAFTKALCQLAPRTPWRQQHLTKDLLNPSSSLHL